MDGVRDGLVFVNIQVYCLFKSIKYLKFSIDSSDQLCQWDNILFRSVKEFAFLRVAKRDNKQQAVQTGERSKGIFHIWICDDDDDEEERSKREGGTKGDKIKIYKYAFYSIV